MAEKFKITVGVAFTIEDYNDKMHTGGDLESVSMRLTYHNGTGISFTANQILYSEGSIGGPQDFFEIKSENSVTLGSSGLLSIILTSQSNVPGGTIVDRTISIGGSLPFVFTLQYS